MRYDRILKAKFLSRPNRFIAKIELEGKEELCHVKNTGRCRELLIPGTAVYVQAADNPERKTKYDLITVEKGERLVNIDSQVPNRVFYEWLTSGQVFQNVTLIKPETTYKHSRFDFYVEADGGKIFIEVKGVTLEKEGAVFFPDAPTERGVKHVRELTECISEGYEAMIFFVIQMKDVSFFAPHDETHRAFGDALREAKKRGVKVMAGDCIVTQDSISPGDFVPVIL